MLGCSAAEGNLIRSYQATACTWAFAVTDAGRFAHISVLTSRRVARTVTVMHSILVVDDYEDARSLLEALLTGAGFRTLTASNGGEGLEVAFTAIPDAIVMDICMPVMDGIRATELLKADPRTASIPVIAYTAQPKSMPNSYHLFAGVCAKPCDPDILLAILRRVLRSDS